MPVGPGRNPLPEEAAGRAAIRGEILSPDRLVERAQELARSDRVSTGRRGKPLLSRLEENGRVLLDCYRAIARAIAEERAISPAAEWLADNFHIVDDQLREIRDDLPPGFYRELPKLANGPLAGYPRVYGIAWSFVEHTDSRLDLEPLRRFLEAYQTVQPLTIGELWAATISLRLVLIENLRRMSEQIVARRGQRERADLLADAILGGEGPPAAGLEDRFRKSTDGAIQTAFLVQLLARLRDRDPERTPALGWIDRRLAREGISRDDLVAAEHRSQLAMHVSVSNVITSMRLMGSVDWSDFFETVSLVERELREDTQVGAMDFGTRDRYRHAVEQLAKGSRRPERQIARLARERAKSSGAPPGSRHADPGYYLISRGRAAFEKEIGYRAPVSQWMRRAWVAWAAPGYPGTILLLALVILSVPLVFAFYAGAAPLVLVLLGLLAFVPASELATAVVNQDVLEVVGPRRLPKLELEDGIPADLATMVVVPTLLLNEDEIREQIEQLEVRFLANSEGFIHFALLADWTDAPSETMDEDEALLVAARAGISELNRRHGSAPDGGERFLLFHRRRVWNASAGSWMGWERKRGKLEEFNRLLRGATDTSYLPTPDPVPTGVRYVITLDGDTRLPRGAVRKLVGAMAHPLNHPAFDDTTNRVVEGNGILQPRITPTLPPIGMGTLFERVFAGPRGIDPYAFAVSDVYQDLFGEGIFTGKGIYDVDAFSRALAGRVPENTLLSHDLFEGLFARAGLVSDVELFEEFPNHYEVSTARQHRWARGDWQLLPWLRGRVKDADGRRVRNAIPFIGRWKIIDNLRRSLFAPAAVATLIAGWTIPGARSFVWSAFVLATLVLPRLFPVLAAAVPRRRNISKRSVATGLGADLALAFSHTVLTSVLLADQAWLMGDAILRTLGRLFFTKRRLLEWTTARQARALARSELPTFLRRMWGVYAIGAAALLPEIFRGAPEAADAVLFVVAWIASPVVAWTISLPPADSEREFPSPADGALLRLLARRTWRFFEAFTGEGDHYLPPDNFQESPKPVVAHRTSPTNIGLYLLSTASAHDLGWIGVTEMVERMEATFETLGKMEKFRGHLYNWYDTESLAPLEPRYISTVDSGNFAAHLITLKQACLERLVTPLPFRDALLGVFDAVRLAREAARSLGATRGSGAAALRDIESSLTALETVLAPSGSDAPEPDQLRDILLRAETLVDAAAAVAHDKSDPQARSLLIWSTAVARALSSHCRDAGIAAGTPASDGSAGISASSANAAARTADPGAGTPADADPQETARTLSRARPLSGPGGVAETLDGNDGSAAIAVAPPPSPPDPVTHDAAVPHALARRLVKLAAAAEKLAEEMEFGFLFDPVQKLFSIGYRVADGRLDPGFYDLLASEARLTSFLAIGRGEVPTSHWFHLGRPLTPVGKGSALVSWSGSMFEYLMPDLVLDVPTGSLLDSSSRLIVGRQIRYATERGVPWGISESAFNARDANLTYQYSNFGVSGLGLKRGLAEDLVIAPYATALAAMVNVTAATKNFRALTRAGAAGEYGFYEAIDYTRSRLPENGTSAVVQAYMAHHQGMTLVALGNVLSGWKMRLRFHSEPMVQATELLLQERTPRGVSVARPRAEEVSTQLHVRDFVTPVLRRFQSPHDATPRAHILSNGRYSVMVTAAGSGYSRLEQTAITRWREDPTRDSWGSYFYLRDVQTGRVWSAGHQPSGVEADSYEVAYYEDRAEIRRRDGSLSTAIEIIVSPEENAELRQVAVTNLGGKVREIDVTSYAELVLNDPKADNAHPVFSNLFVETEFVPGLDALVATRRPRSHDDTVIWAAHLVTVEGVATGGVQYETDRSRFIGRGRDLRSPVSIEEGIPLSNTAGSVLDPIFSLRRRVSLPPGGTARLTFATLAATSREELLSAADRYRDPAIFSRTAMLAWTQAQVQLRHLQISADEAHLFQRLATRILYSDPTMRAASDILRRNRNGAAALWGFGISGDRPIVYLRIDQAEDRDIFKQLLRAQEYWRLKGLAVDLVVSNEEAASYDPQLQSTLEVLLRTSRGLKEDASRGGVFVLRSDQVPQDARDTLAAAARVVVLSRNGSLADQVLRFLGKRPTARPPQPKLPVQPSKEVPPPRPTLPFWNGIGGFSEDGTEYITVLGKGQTTPAPWVNVIANPGFGFLVSESGSGYTWGENSRENQLTPWSNDPVSDPPGEAIYVRDEESGEIWTPTALPIREETPYVAAHGQGYSRFEHESHDIRLVLTQFVDPDDPVKISRLTLENHSTRRRSLSVTSYAEWILGVSRTAAFRFVLTSKDEPTGAVFARNPWTADFGGRVAFSALSVPASGITADRTEFLGRNGSVSSPSGLAPGVTLSGRTGAGLDPCAALQAPLVLAPGEKKEILVLLGQAASEAEARLLVTRHRKRDAAATLSRIRQLWDDVLGGLQVKTPDAALDLLVNRWLLYQALACRIWGRSAFYQSGGAFGFRDQLQDAMAFAVAKRSLLREQILRSAARQFHEGDVQHWWHPPTGKGVRTRFSDDLLWLPYAVTRYIDVTADAAILDERIPFVEGEPLKASEDERFFEPTVSSDTATLFEHCARAIDRSLPAGAHGLPLMGSGDWNDGMNRVGAGGKGESVWLGWFLHANLSEFSKVAEARGETGRAATWRERLTTLKAALEGEGWDGDWWRRAFYDDGTPLGSSQNDECRIDSIAQSWAVISGAGDRDRAKRAMNAVDEYLIRRDGALALLFTPPFNHTAHDPGYIKGYLPGVRENGGQYTHGALWSVIAFAELGDGDRAGELFSLLNPIQHASTRAGRYRYKVEPYVVAADVYAEPPHVGRGGWTWYTGSAGWMYRAAVESILGIRLQGAVMLIDPRIPRAWPRYQATFRYHSARYVVTVENPRSVCLGVTALRVDGRGIPDPKTGVPLVDDGGIHSVDVLLG